MNRLKKLSVVALLVVSVACASSAQKVAYDVLGIAATAVDTGMKVYADRVVAGAVSQALQTTVRADYTAYQSAMKDAQAAVNIWLALGTPPPPALYPTGQVSVALNAAAKLQAEVK